MRTIAFDVDSPSNLFSMFALFQDWAIGSCLLTLFFTIIDLGLFAFLDASFGIKYQFVPRYQRGLEAFKSFAVSAVQNLYSEQQMQDLYIDIKETIINPMLKYWLFQFFSILFGMVLGYLYYSVNIYFFDTCSTSSFGMMVSIYFFK